MQSLSTSVSSRVSAGAGPLLSGQLVVALNEAMALPPDRVARSVAIVRLIEEMHATLQWLRGSASGNAELASLAQVCLLYTSPSPRDRS